MPTYMPLKIEEYQEQVRKQAESLSYLSQAVLGQLFVYGPTRDMQLVSRDGRDELVKICFVYRWLGWNSLTEDGLEAALRYDTVKNAYHTTNYQLLEWWKKKQEHRI